MYLATLVSVSYDYCWKYVLILYFQINGVNLEKVTHNEAVECFVRAKETVSLKVQQGAHAEIMVSLENDY